VIGDTTPTPLRPGPVAADLLELPVLLVPWLLDRHDIESECVSSDDLGALSRRSETVRAQKPE
jgi:hypothetical protein